MATMEVISWCRELKGHYPSGGTANGPQIWQVLQTVKVKCNVRTNMAVITNSKREMRVRTNMAIITKSIVGLFFKEKYN